MSASYRLTRRGRLLLTTLPLFLVTAGGLNVLVDRVGDEPANAAISVAETPSPTSSPTPSPTPRPKPRKTASPTTTPSPTPRATRTAAPAVTGTGRLVMAPGSSAVHGSGPVRRFTVEVEAGLTETPAAIAAAVERVLFDKRSWSGAFQRVSSGPVAFRVVLASPATTDRLCYPLRTGGIFSCYQRGRVVLNAWRWRNGATSYAGDLASYRIYMVNHEVGHALGRGHRFDCGPGGLAPVMIQQTKGLRGCARNPWPLPTER